MKKLIEFLLSGCWHEWETIEEVPIRQNLYDMGSGMARHLETNKGTRYILRCKKCGEITHRNVI